MDLYWVTCFWLAPSGSMDHISLMPRPLRLDTKYIFEPTRLTPPKLLQDVGGEIVGHLARARLAQRPE